MDDLTPDSAAKLDPTKAIGYDLDEKRRPKLRDEKGILVRDQKNITDADGRLLPQEQVDSLSEQAKRDRKIARLESQGGLSPELKALREDRDRDAKVVSDSKAEAQAGRKRFVYQETKGAVVDTKGYRKLDGSGNPVDGLLSKAELPEGAVIEEKGRRLTITPGAGGGTRTISEIELPSEVKTVQSDHEAKFQATQNPRTKMTLNEEIRAAGGRSGLRRVENSVIEQEQDELFKRKGGLGALPPPPDPGGADTKLGALPPPLPTPAARTPNSALCHPLPPQTQMGMTTKIPKIIKTTYMTAVIVVLQTRLGEVEVPPVKEPKWRSLGAK